MQGSAFNTAPLLSLWQMVVLALFLLVLWALSRWLKSKAKQGQLPLTQKTGALNEYHVATKKLDMQTSLYRIEGEGRRYLVLSGPNGMLELCSEECSDDTE